MSHLILGVIGIILAAAASLLVLNYGGDYFLDAASDGEAMNVENALNNVLTASRLHEMRTGAVSTKISDLMPTTGSGTLKYAPQLKAPLSMDSQWKTFNIDGQPATEVIIINVSDAVCLSMNKRLSRSSIPTSPTGVLGCYKNGSVNTAYRKL